MQKSLFLIPVKDIKIPDIFFKIQKFIRASWASVIAHKVLLVTPYYLDEDSPLAHLPYTYTDETPPISKIRPFSKFAVKF